MTEHDAVPADLAEEFDDLDVEGHGLKEVTIALSAAGVVLGGAGVALAGGPFDGTAKAVGGAGSTATQEAGDFAGATRDGVDRTADRTTDWGISTSTGVRTAHVDPKVDLAQEQLDVAKDHVQTTQDDVDQTVRDVRQDPVGWVDDRTDSAMDSAQDAVDTTRTLRDGVRTTSVRIVAQVPSTVESVEHRVERHVEADVSGGDAEVRVHGPRM